MDFTINTYQRLLVALQTKGYHFYTFERYLHRQPSERFVILRHDVDELPNNALNIAQSEYDLGIKATYYFRIVKQSNNPEVIKKIRDMGHEIGYHYEDLSTAKGDYDKAISSFKKNLEYFRSYYPVKTVCMHGSSSSQFDNRTLWKKYKLEDFGVIGEPYLSIDFTRVFYLTDTGYAWDGGKYAVRDVVENHFGITFHSTNQIIDAIEKGIFPDHTMILAHTLWTDNMRAWWGLHAREYLRNNIKLIARNNKIVSIIYKKAVECYWGK